MSVLLFTAALSLLLLEGWIIAGLFVRDRSFRASLALPLAALSNVLLFFVLTILHVPLRSSFVLAGHVIVLVLLVIARRCSFARCSSNQPTSNGQPRLHHRFLNVLCIILLTGTFFYSVTHAVLLPTFQYDSATNWIMRSKASFLEERIVFDNDPPHQVIRKPHYPFLLHALHLQANLEQRAWSDRAANTLAFLLSWSALASIGLLICRLRGGVIGLVGVTLVASIPLFAVHLGEGYADHLLALFAALSFLSLAHVLSLPSLHSLPSPARRAYSAPSAWFMLSAIFAAAAVWTKAEGLFFVFVPWFSLMAVSLRAHGHDARRAMLLASVLALPWPLFALLQGLSLTPHGASDLQIGFQAESIELMVKGLFLSGSFGVLWTLLPAAAALLLLRADRTFLVLPLFGLASFLLVIMVYTLTPNVEYLASAQSFDRQMLTPAVLLLLALLLLWRKPAPHAQEPVPRPRKIALLTSARGASS